MPISTLELPGRNLWPLNVRGYPLIRCQHILTLCTAAMAAARNKFQETDAPLPSIAYVAIGSSKLKVRPVPVCMGDDFGNCPPGSVFE